MREPQASCDKQINVHRRLSLLGAGSWDTGGRRDPTSAQHMKRRNIDLVITAMWLGITGFDLLGTGRRVAGTYW